MIKQQLTAVPVLCENNNLGIKMYNLKKTTIKVTDNNFTGQKVQFTLEVSENNHTMLGACTT